MSTTQLNLGEHWDRFIKSRIESGRYCSASEIVCESLRLLEERETRLEALRTALEAGEKSGVAGPLDMGQIKAKARQRADL